MTTPATQPTGAGLGGAANLAQPWAKLVITPVAREGRKWDNETSPRRCANTVIPGALTNHCEGVIG